MVNTDREIIARGAEAILYVSDWEGQRVLVKERIKKNYRIAQIDEKLRKDRTRLEARLLTEARKHGVPTPKILHVDEYKIIMQFVDGGRIKELLIAAGEKSDEKTIERVCVEIGQSIGKLHAADIVHGDLTTSNMILCAADGRIYFIDFGLGDFSRRVEAKGVDMLLLRNALKAAHYRILSECWENILKGYKQEYKDADEVIRKVGEIERRARYAKRDAG
jgi:Kae1-associated kinase Bud32